MSDQWLDCQISKGMFSDEFVVEYEALSFFVPRNQVKGAVDGKGKVRVRTFSKGVNWFAVLPTEDQAIVRVNPSDLVAA